MDFRTDLEKRFFEEEQDRINKRAENAFITDSPAINYQLMAQLEAKRLGRPYCIVAKSEHHFPYRSRGLAYGSVRQDEDECYFFYQCTPPDYKPKLLELYDQEPLPFE